MVSGQFHERLHGLVPSAASPTLAQPASSNHATATGARLHPRWHSDRSKAGSRRSVGVPWQPWVELMAGRAHLIIIRSRFSCVSIASLRCLAAESSLEPPQPMLAPRKASCWASRTAWARGERERDRQRWTRGRSRTGQNVSWAHSASVLQIELTWLGFGNASVRWAGDHRRG